MPPFWETLPFCNTKNLNYSLRLYYAVNNKTNIYSSFWTHLHYEDLHSFWTIYYSTVILSTLCVHFLWQDLSNFSENLTELHLGSILFNKSCTIQRKIQIWSVRLYLELCWPKNFIDPLPQIDFIGTRFWLTINNDDTKARIKSVLSVTCTKANCVWKIPNNCIVVAVQLKMSLLDDSTFFG